MAPRTVTELGEQAVEHAQKSATEATLWDKAYIALKDEGNKERFERIAKYEDLLSRVLLRGLCSFPSPAFLAPAVCNCLFSNCLRKG